jgi:hypothetical protein
LEFKRTGAGNRRVPSLLFHGFVTGKLVRNINRALPKNKNENMNLVLETNKIFYVLDA